MAMRYGWCFAAACLIVTMQSAVWCQPSDWIPLIRRGDMVWTNDLPFPDGWLTGGTIQLSGTATSPRSQVRL